jgi:methylamine--corrinoid protein Co-methyltransferase
LYSKYEHKLRTPDIGKPFEDCYDMKTIEPTREYADLYESVIAEIHQMVQQKNRRATRK